MRQQHLSDNWHPASTTLAMHTTEQNSMKLTSTYGLSWTGTFTPTVTANLQANMFWMSSAASPGVPLPSVASSQIKIDISFKMINHSLVLQSRLCNLLSAAKWVVNPLIGTYWCGMKDRHWNNYAEAGGGGVLEQSEAISFFFPWHYDCRFNNNAMLAGIPKWLHI